MFPGTRRGLRVGGIAGVIVAIIAIVIVVLAMTRVRSGANVTPSGPCVGGPAQGATGQSIGHGNYRFTCVDRGSAVVYLGG